jgi:hypothetical protein
MQGEFPEEVDIGAFGRGQGIDWTRSVTFETDLEVRAYLEDSNLSRCRTNHNIGIRVNYLKCSIPGCTYQCRLLENINHGAEVPHFEIEIAPDLEHNHQAVVARERGLTFAQKSIIRQCIARGQAAPKKVRLNFIYY